MSKLTILYNSTILLLQILSSISGNENEASQPSYTMTVESMNEFAVDFFKSTSSQENQLFSPLSIFSAFSMIALGARNNTWLQINRALRSSDEAASSNDSTRYRSLSDLRVELMRQVGNCSLSVASKLFVDESVGLLRTFIDDCLEYFGASPESLDLRKHPQDGARRVNEWVSNQTSGKIEGVLSDDIDSLVSLILVDAIYFRGNWKYRFNPNLSKEQNFGSSSSSSSSPSSSHSLTSQSKDKTVMMMQMTKTKLKHAQVKTLNCEALELPYEGDSTSMIILLPLSGDIQLEEVKKNLTYSVLQSTSFQETDVVVLLPKFKLKKSYPLDVIFKKLGVFDLFNPSIADLSGMNDSKELYVSKAVHKSGVEVDEEGTTASAATVVTVVERKSLVLYFVVDRPFIFYIRDNKSGAILFFGQFAHPE